VAYDYLGVLAYNLYMRPQHLFHNGQGIRSRLLPKHLTDPHHDVLVLCELFDDSVRKDVVEALSEHFPHRTRVVGEDRGLEQDGGVVILSRHPIDREEQRTFDRVFEGSDGMADKGVMYARVCKDGRHHHVFGTHTDAGGEGAEARRAQFQLIRDFIDELEIPKDDFVVVAGDLNVDRIGRVEEHERMLRILRANMPESIGHESTYDPETNDLCSGSRSQYLDYALWSWAHKKPRRAVVEVRKLKSFQKWREYPWEPVMRDLSDHYPVYGWFELE